MHYLGLNYLWIIISLAHPRLLMAVTEDAGKTNATVCRSVDGMRWYERCLYDTLLMTSGYQRSVLPRVNASEPVHVNVGFSLRVLTDMNEKEETMTVGGFVTATWKDPFLKWEPDVHGGLEKLSFTTEQIWFPDFAISNSAGSLYDESFSKLFRSTVHSTGRVVWSFGAQFVVLCNLDIAYYPFDTQECQVILENWAYTQSEVNLASTGIDVGQFRENSLWELISYKGEAITLSSTSPEYANETFVRVIFKIKWQRKTRFYTFNFLIPSAFLSIMSLGTFWLPPDCGEKISFGITVMLSFTIYQIVLIDSVPVNSDQTPMLNTLIIGMITGALIALLSSMLTVVLSLTGGLYPVPRSIRRIFLGKLPKYLCLRVPPKSDLDDQLKAAESMQPGQGADKHDSSGNAKPNPAVPTNAVSNQVDGVLQEVRKITTSIQEQTRENEVAEEWKLLAKVVDRLLFWIYFLAVFVFLLVYSLSIYIHRTS